MPNAQRVGTGWCPGAAKLRGRSCTDSACRPLGGARMLWQQQHCAPTLVAFSVRAGQETVADHWSHAARLACSGALRGGSK